MSGNDAIDSAITRVQAYTVEIRIAESALTIGPAIDADPLAERN
jgi:hypothetical protein